MMRFDAMRDAMLLALAWILTGCSARYVTPGGHARLDDINRADSAEIAVSSSDTVDRKRLAAEQEACRLLLAEAQQTWDGIVAEHAS